MDGGLWGSALAVCDNSGSGALEGRQVLVCKSDTHMQIFNLDMSSPGQPVLREAANVYSTTPVQLLAAHQGLLVVSDGHAMSFYRLRPGEETQRQQQACIHSDEAGGGDAPGLE